MLILNIITSIITSIVTPIVSLFTKKEDTKIEKYKVDGQVNIEDIHKDIEVTKAITALSIASKEDPIIKYGRILFVYPTGIYYSFVIGDSILHRFFMYNYRVEEMPSNLMYIPYAVIAFLFGYVIFNKR